MQKVIYVNAYGESITFGREGPLLLSSVTGFSRTDADVISTRGMGQHGVMVQEIHLPERHVQVKFDLLPQGDRRVMYEKRMQIERVLSIGRAERNGKIGLLIYENDAGRWQTEAVPEGQITYGKRFVNALPANRVKFVCPSAYLESAEEQISQMMMGQNGMKLPTKLPLRLGSRRFQASLTNYGTAACPVFLTIHGTGETPKIINHTTGTKLIVERTIATGEELLIHTDPRDLSCRLKKNDGEVEDAFGYLDPSIAVSAFVLAPGVNRLEYVPSRAAVNSRIEVQWRSYYEGV